MSRNEPSNSPLKFTDDQVRSLMENLLAERPDEFLYRKKLAALPSMRAICSSTREIQAACLDWAIEYVKKHDKSEYKDGTAYVCGDHERLDRIGYAVELLLNKSLPVSMDTAERFYDEADYRFCFTDISAGKILTLIESASRNEPLHTQFVVKLRKWRRSFDVGYGQNKGSARARLDALIKAGSKRKVAPKKARISDVPGLVAAYKDAVVDICAGNPRHFDIDADLFTGFSPGAALDALLQCISSRILENDAKGHHLARYVVDRAGFKRVEELAPELCFVLKALFAKAGKHDDHVWEAMLLDSGREPVIEETASFNTQMRQWDRFFAVHLRSLCLRHIVETLWLARFNLPKTFKAFHAVVLIDNSHGDCHTWGDSFEPIEDEADRGDPLIVLPGDAWTDRLREDLSQMPEDRRQLWLDLLNHCGWTDWAKPTKKWLAEAAKLTAPLGDELPERLSTYLNLFGTRGSRKKNLWGWPEDPTIGRGANNRTLRGLIWASLTPQANPTRELCSAIAAAGIAGDKKVIRLGPRAIIVRNAAIEGLSASPCEFAPPCLAVIDFMMKYKAGRKRSASAVKRLAAEQGLTRDQFIERTVPTYEFDDRSTKSINFKGKPFQLFLVAPGEVSAEGPEKSQPPEAREIRRVLAAHKLRLERLLATSSQWPFSDWQSWYGDHPLLAPITSRLIWTVDSRSATYANGRWTDSRGGKILCTAKTLIRPWHPATATAEDITAWRIRLESQNIKQPFAQAHRHIYILTPAESGPTNQTQRFTGHVLHAPKFRALLRERMWEGDPVITFDTANSPATLVLEHADLTATFQTMPLDVDESSGLYTRVATGAIALSRISDGSAVQVSTIPPAVFSEVLRDVDLFVSTCSVGLDPLWLDAHGRNDYAWDFAFGALASSAAARHDVLKTLLPRLKIANSCTLADRFLQVRGKLRTYKIHLGSANVMMSPNDEYLCIVPARGQTDYFDLPFDGDPILSIIVSKAFMLAEDDTITDPSIAKQIKRDC